MWTCTYEYSVHLGEVTCPPNRELSNEKYNFARVLHFLHISLPSLHDWVLPIGHVSLKGYCWEGNLLVLMVDWTYSILGLLKDLQRVNFKHITCLFTCRISSHTAPCPYPPGELSPLDAIYKDLA